MVQISQNKSNGERESIGEFVPSMTKLSTHCNFGEFLDKMLRGRFICGLNFEFIQIKLLAQADITFAKALIIVVQLSHHNSV